MGLGNKVIKGLGDLGFEGFDNCGIGGLLKFCPEQPCLRLKLLATTFSSLTYEERGSSQTHSINVSHFKLKCIFESQIWFLKSFLYSPYRQYNNGM